MVAASSQAFLSEQKNNLAQMELTLSRTASMTYRTGYFALTPSGANHSISPESSDGLASVGTILPSEEATLLPGGLFRPRAPKKWINLQGLTCIPARWRYVLGFRRGMTASSCLRPEILVRVQGYTYKQQVSGSAQNAVTLVFRSAGRVYLPPAFRASRPVAIATAIFIAATMFRESAMFFPAISNAVP
jgi:hypothetical protein